jgi:2-polyprenyl-6-methoxyphenol hydroxylase-like FAD-dependent oxidoreductase
VKKNIAIVGAGVGGLSTAARLAYHGYQVDVYKKLPSSLWQKKSRDIDLENRLANVVS